MEKFVILADVTCDLNEDIRKAIGMDDYVRGHIHFDDGRDFLTTLDWDTMSKQDFYTAISNKKVKVTTAPPNIEEYCEVFEKYVKDGYGIISIALSSKISSTFEFSQKAANRIKESYPDARIACVDSFRMSGAFGLLVLYAHVLKNEGKSFEEVVEWLEENKRKVHQMGPIDDLFFIARRGRISMGKAIMGSFAGVKPMGDCNADGYTTVITKVKGMNKALDITVRYIEKSAVDIKNQYVLVISSNRDAYAQALKEKIEAELAPKAVYITDVFCGCGANIGPGMVGAYYLGEPISEDLSVEKEIITSITGK